MRRRLALGLAALTLLAFGHVLLADFIDLDDPVYVFNNPHVLSGLNSANITWAWSTYRGSLYQPLTWMSLQADAQVFGSSAFGFHLTNLVLHTCNVLLLFFILDWLTKQSLAAALVAALFAVHPMHVESVAWITERKDVLVTFFWLLMIAAHGWYCQKPGFIRYLLVLLAFVAGLLTKAMIVTAPFLLLLLDLWPLGRYSQQAGFGRAGRLLVEKVPLLVLALAASWITMHTLNLLHPALLNTDSLPLTQRVATAIAAYGWYLAATLMPMDLALSYPTAHVSTAQVLLSASAVFGLTAASVWCGRFSPAVPVGWFWFLGTLFPVAAFASAGTTPWADRYTYFPHIGLFIALVWGAIALLNRLHVPVVQRKLLAVATVIACAWGTWFQVWHWCNSETLFTHTLNVTADNPLAHHALASYYARMGDPTRAETHFARAVELDPANAAFLAHYGQALVQRQAYDEAIEVLRRGVHVDSTHAECHFFLGLALANINRLEEAADHLRQFLQYAGKNPAAADAGMRVAEAYELLGDISLRAGEPRMAIDHLAQALRLRPDSAWSQLALGIAHGRLDRWTEAEFYLHRATELDPLGVYGESYLAHASMRQGKKEAAAKQYERLLGRVPDWPQKINEHIGPTLTEARSLDVRTGLELAEQMCEATGKRDPRLLDTLAAAQAANGAFDKARQTARGALEVATDPALRRQLQERLLLYEQEKALPIR